MLKIVRKRWAVGSPSRTSLRELTALPQTLQLVGRGLLPSFQELHPALRLRPFGLADNKKSWACH